MSQSPAPLQYQTPQTAAQPSNTLGLVGFILVMVGLFGFCFGPAFLLGIVGAVMCGIAVFKTPRGLAIAGLIVGLVELAIVGFVVFVLGVILVSGANTASQNTKTALGRSNASTISFNIDRFQRENNRLPATLAELSLTSDTTDGFGNQIRYLPNLTAGTYKLMGNGWDGKPNTADDFTLHDSAVKPWVAPLNIPTMPPARKPASVPAFPKFEDDPK